MDCQWRYTTLAPCVYYWLKRLNTQHLNQPTKIHKSPQSYKTLETSVINTPFLLGFQWCNNDSGILCGGDGTHSVWFAYFQELDKVSGKTLPKQSIRTFVTFD